MTLTIQRGDAAPVRARRSPATSSRSRRSISKDLADGTVGYVRLTGFSDTGAARSQDALEAHVEAGRTALILDLRGNPGGYVTAARTVASQFIASGPIFWEQDAEGTQIATDAMADGVATDPTSGSSASSMAGAPRRARSSRGPCRTASAPRWSASRRSARGPSSSGRS